MKKSLLLLIIPGIISCSFTSRNTGDPVYKFNRGDTVYNRKTKQTYVIDSAQTARKKQAFYFATNTKTGEHVKDLVENALMRKE
jgi:hypothetical protein